MPLHALRIKRSGSYPEGTNGRAGYITAVTDDGHYSIQFLNSEDAPWAYPSLVDGMVVGEVDDLVGTMVIHRDFESILTGERVVRYSTPIFSMEKGRLLTKPFFVTEKHPPSSAKGRSKYTRGRGRPKVDRKQSTT